MPYSAGICDTQHPRPSEARCTRQRYVLVCRFKWDFDLNIEEECLLLAIATRKAIRTSLRAVSDAVAHCGIVREAWCTVSQENRTLITVHTLYDFALNIYGLFRTILGHMAELYSSLAIGLTCLIADLELKSRKQGPVNKFGYNLWRWSKLMSYLRLHRVHMGTRRCDVTPAFFRRSKFSAGDPGHPSFAFSRRGLSE